MGIDEKIVSFEISLEEIVNRVKTPPLFEQIDRGEIVVLPEFKEKMPLIRKDYETSLKRIISYPSQKKIIAFRTFLRMYKTLFDSDSSNILSNLGNEGIEFILGSLEFDQNTKNYEPFILKYSINLIQ